MNKQTPIQITEWSESKMVIKCGSTSGVYFLKKRGKVVYVGQSWNVLSRVFSDHYCNKDFDEVEIHWVPRDNLLEYEREHISKHKETIKDLKFIKRRKCTAQEPAIKLQGVSRIDVNGEWSKPQS
jgi:hypothetical protein